MSIGNTGCSLKKPNLYKKEGVLLRPQSKLTSGTTEMGKLLLHHPATISEEVLRNQLLSLHYQELSLTGKEKPVYEREEANQLAPLLVRGLKRISPKSILFHQINNLRYFLEFWLSYRIAN